MSHAEKQALVDDASTADLREAISALWWHDLNERGQDKVRVFLWLKKARQEAADARYADERAVFAAAQEKFTTPLAAE
jgi:hypothetical protein